MDELGKEANEIYSPRELRMNTNSGELKAADLTEDDLEADFDHQDASSDLQFKDASDAKTSDLKRSVADLEADHQSAMDKKPECTKGDESKVETGDINEHVPKNWKNIEGDHNIESDTERVNPHFDPEVNDEWANNCQSCAPAYEMRRRGYDVEAKPFTQENAEIARKPEAAWDNPEVQNTEGNGKADIEKKMKEWGDGTRAEVIVYWKSGGGHVFSAEQVNGETRFIDSQTASCAEMPRDAGGYFDQVKDDGSTRFWRTDNINPSSRIKDCCKEAKQ